jgi:hypothetical protein
LSGVSNKHGVYGCSLARALQWSALVPLGDYARRTVLPIRVFEALFYKNAAEINKMYTEWVIPMWRNVHLCDGSVYGNWSLHSAHA